MVLVWSALVFIFVVNSAFAASRSINSIGFKSLSVEYDRVTFDLYVNEEISFSSKTVENLNTDYFHWIDFEANSGDSIFVKFDENSPEILANMIFSVANGPGGMRAQLYDSTMSTIYPPNYCEDESNACTFTIKNLFVGHGWGTSSIAIYVNDNLVMNYDGSEIQAFNVFKGSEIKIIETFSSSTTTLPAGYYLSYDSNGLGYYEKYLNSLPSSTFIPNPTRLASLSIVGNPTILSAGSVFSFTLSSTAQNTYNVQLACSGTSTIESSYPLNSGENAFTITDAIWGDNCWFSIESPVYSDILFVTVNSPVTVARVEPSSTVYFNQNFKLILNSLASSLVDLVTVTQVCGADTYHYEDVQVGEEFTVTPKTDFTGICKYSSAASGVFQASSTDLEVTISKGSVIFSDRASIPTLIAAGEKMTVNLSALPSDLEFDVELICSLVMTAIFKITSGGNYSDNVEVPSDFFGDACLLTVTVPLELYSYDSGHQDVGMTVTQDLTFTQVSTSIIRPEKLNLFPHTSGNAGISADLLMKLECGELEATFTVKTNENSEFSPDQNMNGNCLVSLLENPEYLEATLFSQAVSIKTDLSIKASDDVKNLQSSFKILIGPVGSVIFGHESVPLILICGGNLMAFWNEVPLNDEVVLSLPPDSKFGMELCTLTAADGSEFYVTTTIAVKTAPNHNVPHPVISFLDENDCKNYATKIGFGNVEVD